MFMKHPNPCERPWEGQCMNGTREDDHFRGEQRNPSEVLSTVTTLVLAGVESSNMPCKGKQ